MCFRKKNFHVSNTWYKSLSGDNAVLQFLRLFDPRDLGAINQDSPVIIVRISINFLTCLKKKLQKTTLIYALICYHLSSPVLIQIEIFYRTKLFWTATNCFCQVKIVLIAYTSFWPCSNYSFKFLDSNFQGSGFYQSFEICTTMIWQVLDWFWIGNV